MNIGMRYKTTLFAFLTLTLSVLFITQAFQAAEKKYFWTDEDMTLNITLTRGYVDTLLQGAKTHGNTEVTEIKNKFGDEAIMKLGDQPKVDVDVVPTGSIGLNHALGIGGLPRGRIVEIFGPESSGKTTLALHVVAEAQKKIFELSWEGAKKLGTWNSFR